MRKYNVLKAVLVCGIFFCCAQLKAQSATPGAADSSQIFIDVGQAKLKRSLVALPPFQFFGSAKDLESIRAGQKILATLTNNLEVSGLFTFVKPEAYLEDPTQKGLRPVPVDPNGFNFKNWETIGTEFLVRVGYRVVAGKISLETYVYYVPKANLVLGRTYEGPISAARKLAHSFADDILQSLTGKKGFFNSKFVTVSTRSGGKSKEVFLMDWDGENVLQISKHNSIALSPAWSPKGNKIAYTAYEYHPKNKSRNPDLFMFDIPTGKRTLVSYRKGMNSGAAFAPDDKHIYLTLSQKGTPDIFKMTFDGTQVARLTDGPLNSMNVEPAVSADGTQIAFSSDRSGTPMVYTMSASGGNVTRKTFSGKFNSSPAWSPDGTKIAFAGFDKTHFDIFVMDSSGQNLKRLTSATKPNGKPASNEDPSFSPDGRFISYVSDRTGKFQIYIIGVDGLNERRITLDNFDYTRPKWSPHLN